MFEFERRRDEPVKYDRELMAKTLTTMKRVAEIKANREQRCVHLPPLFHLFLIQQRREDCVCVCRVFACVSDACVLTLTRACVLAMFMSRSQ